MADIDNIFKLAGLLKKLKFEERFKPIDAIRQKESVAAHTWRLSVLALVIGRELELDLDLEKAIKIALLHDLPEAVTGDIDASATYQQEEVKQAKEADEKEAMDKIKAMIPVSSQEEIASLWQEYSRLESREARFIYALDKIEGIYSYLEYDIPEFLNNDLAATYHKIGYEVFPELKPILDELGKRLKQEFEKRNIQWKQEYDN